MLCASSPGRDVLYTAFLSSDELGRNIFRPLVMWAMAVMLAAVLCEYVLRAWLRARARDG